MDNKLERLAAYFIQHMGVGEKYQDVDDITRLKYRVTFLINKGTEDVINYIWITTVYDLIKKVYSGLSIPTNITITQENFPALQRMQ